MNQPTGLLAPIVEQFGAELYLEPKRFHAILTDLIPAEKEARKVLTFILKREASITLYQNRALSPQDFESARRKLIQKLEEDTMIAPEKLEPGVNLLCQGLGFDPPTVFAPETAPASAPVPAPVTMTESVPASVTMTESVPASAPASASVTMTESVPVTAPVTMTESAPSDWFDYEMQGSGVTITGVKSQELPRELVLPTMIQGKPVTAIGEYAFFECTALTQITLPPTVTAIESYAFDGCTALTQVTLPDGLTTLGEGVFLECTALRQVNLPAGLTDIDVYTFYLCTALSQIALPDGLTTLGWNAFRECSSLSQITLPAGLTEIGEYAFLECTALTQIALPAGLTEIGETAFGGCTALSQVTLSRKTKLHPSAFADCPKVKFVYLD